MQATNTQKRQHVFLRAIQIQGIQPYSAVAELAISWLLYSPATSDSNCTGTPIYIAPEVLKMKYSLPADLWSAGIIAYQLVTGRLPFTGEEGEEVSTQYMEKKQFDHKVGLVQSLISICWHLASKCSESATKAMLTSELQQNVM